MLLCCIILFFFSALLCSSSITVSTPNVLHMQASTCMLMYFHPSGPTVCSWLQRYWNEVLAPSVHRDVVSGCGQHMTRSAQLKVADTALFVLLTTAVLPGCPVPASGQCHLLLPAFGPCRPQLVKNNPGDALWLALQWFRHACVTALEKR